MSTNYAVPTVDTSQITVTVNNPNGGVIRYAYFKFDPLSGVATQPTKAPITSDILKLKYDPILNRILTFNGQTVGVIQSDGSVKITDATVLPNTSNNIVISEYLTEEQLKDPNIILIGQTPTSGYQTEESADSTGDTSGGGGKKQYEDYTDNSGSIPNYDTELEPINPPSGYQTEEGTVDQNDSRDSDTTQTDPGSGEVEIINAPLTDDNDDEIDLTDPPGFNEPDISGPYPQEYESPLDPIYPPLEEETPLYPVQIPLEFEVYFKPALFLVETEYSDDIEALVLDYPPTPPVPVFYPIRDCIDKFAISLSPSIGTIREPGKPMEGIDVKRFATLLRQQHSSDGKITFRYEGDVKQYEMYRIEEAPTSYWDFLKSSTLKKTLFDKGENFLTYEYIEPNKEYFYTFRTIDRHSLVSNPTPVLKVILYVNDGVEWLDISSYNFKIPPKILSKSFKRHLKITPNLNQRTYSELDEKLGLVSESVYNQRFLLQITSKHTGKRMNIIIKFNKETDENDRSGPNQ